MAEVLKIKVRDPGLDVTPVDEDQLTYTDRHGVTRVVRLDHTQCTPNVPLRWLYLSDYVYTQNINP